MNAKRSQRWTWCNERTRGTGTATSVRRTRNLAGLIQKMYEIDEEREEEDKECTFRPFLIA